jgi:hypothetical protein
MTTTAVTIPPTLLRQRALRRIDKIERGYKPVEPFTCCPLATAIAVYALVDNVAKGVIGNDDRKARAMLCNGLMVRATTMARRVVCRIHYIEPARLSALAPPDPYRKYPLIVNRKTVNWRANCDEMLRSMQKRVTTGSNALRMSNRAMVAAARTVRCRVPNGCFSPYQPLFVVETMLQEVLRRAETNFPAAPHLMPLYSQRTLPTLGVQKPPPRLKPEEEYQCRPIRIRYTWWGAEILHPTYYPESEKVSMTTAPRFQKIDEDMSSLQPIGSLVSLSAERKRV